MSHLITDIAALEALYGTPGAASLDKVAPEVTPLYGRWIARARFCILSTVGPDGTDASPRGDDGPVVRIVDSTTLLLPDWHGNNRMDSLRNIVEDGRVSLLFMVPGADNVIRINGRAQIDTDPQLRAQFARGKALPRSVIRIAVDEVYFQCARALKRAALWSGDASAGLPSPGDLIREQTAGFDAERYDRDWPARAESSMW